MKDAPGTGVVYTAMTPLWGTIPPTKGNKYYEAVNELLGSDDPVPDHRRQRLRRQAGHRAGLGQGRPGLGLRPHLEPAAAVRLRDRRERVPGPHAVPRRATRSRRTRTSPTSPRTRGSSASSTASSTACRSRARSSPTRSSTAATSSTGSASPRTSRTARTSSTSPSSSPAAACWGAEDLWNTAAIIHAVPPKWKLDGDGKLVHRVETEEYRAALEWNAALFASGAVHPDAVADQSGEAKARFQSGKSLIANDGVGGWHEAHARQPGQQPRVLAAAVRPVRTPTAARRCSGRATRPTSSRSSRRRTTRRKIKELLAIANVLAAPYGTTEYDTINNGVEGVHYTRGDDGLPGAHRPGGHRAAADLHLPGRPADRRRPTCSTRATSRRRRSGRRTRPSTRPTRCSTRQQIVEPQQYASIGQPFVDLEKDISRGRKAIERPRRGRRDVEGVRRRRAAGVLPGHPGPAELMSLSELVRRRAPR